MAYIYCITNQINGKRYVGKTTKTISERFQEHCKDYLKDKNEKRPLYDAMRKYGIEQFIVEQLEEVEEETLSEREIYWIQELQTYGSNGYNATKGGDGSILYDYREIIELYNLGFSSGQVAQKVGCSVDTVTNVLKAHGIQPRGHSNKVNQYDLEGNYLRTFDSTTLAEQWLIENGYTKSKKAHAHITEVCKGKRPSMYKHKWKFYLDDPK